MNSITVETQPPTGTAPETEDNPPNPHRPHPGTAPTATRSKIDPSEIRQDFQTEHLYEHQPRTNDL
jgi:hypothetical protein